MKLSAILALTTTTNAFNPTEDGDRRWGETVEMFQYYNPNVDPGKLMGYGCNCLQMGDRILSGQTHLDTLNGDTHPGAPVDLIDGICQSYKQCVKCAMEKHDDCTPEFLGGSKKRYQMTVPTQPNGEITCTNNPGSCKRDMCECSKIFTRQFRTVDWSTAWKPEHSIMTQGPTKFNPAIGCVPGGARNTPDHQCCQANSQEGPFKLYNPDLKTCCPDGSLVAFGEFC